MNEDGVFAGVTRLVDVVFPGDTNHHGTLFGGAALAHMDRAAFIAAARHGRVDFATASCERIDFRAPAHIGDILDLSARVVRVGRRSLSVDVVLTAEATLTGDRRVCAEGTFHMVALGTLLGDADRLPPLPLDEVAADIGFRAAQVVFPDQTSHYGSLYGGDAMAAMGKAAFIVATRRCRSAVVMASAARVDFKSQVKSGEIIELTASTDRVGRTSLEISVELHAQPVLQGKRRFCGAGRFTMVAIDGAGKPQPINRGQGHVV